ncbi:MAG: c-type cytochrome [Acidobacteriota bacterium]|nr:c-type cytochrome [Acidobacteriota bacterium]
MRLGINVLLGLVLAATVGAHFGLSADPTLPNREFLPNMVRSIPADAFAPSAVLPGGQTLQAPPPGTIPRGLLPLHYAATPEDAIRAGLELTNPFAPDDQKAINRGTVVFGNYCAACHGPGGLGDGLVTRRGVPPPPSLLVDNALKIADGQMFHIVTYGQKNMSSYASQVSREDRWKAILYVRLLQRQATARVAAPAPPSAPASAPQPR